ncbi:MAG: FixH family protein [Alphaproteobacteria bacterium]|nr:FixH family protein [Alphaproteobacteria bacterium]
MSARPSDRFIPWYFVLFFSMLAALFTWFVYLAHTTHPGVVTDDAYEKGLKYNIQISRADAQKKLGWTSATDVRRDGGKAFTLSFTLKDKSGAPVTGAKASVRMMRPSNASMDFSMAMTETAPGIYTAALGDPAIGLWEAQIGVSRGQELYQSEKRMELKDE